MDQAGTQLPLHAGRCRVRQPYRCREVWSVRGEGTAWANPDQMEATFISALNDFTLDRNLPIIEGGLMRVDLATEFWANAERRRRPN